MKVSEAMTRDVHVASPEETVQKAARTMGSLDAGCFLSARTTTWSA
jgi:CBS domain-containing protein